MKTPIILFCLLFCGSLLAQKKMSTDDNKALLKKFYADVFEKGNPDAAVNYIAKDAVDHQGMPGQKAGLEGIIEFFKLMHAAYPELKVTVDDMIAEGDKVVATMTMKGVNKGPFMGTPASNKEITMKFIDIVKFKDGKMTEHWGYGNDMEVMAQMGMVPMPIQEKK